LAWNTQKQTNQSVEKQPLCRIKRGREADGRMWNDRRNEKSGRRRCESLEFESAANRVAPTRSRMIGRPTANVAKVATCAHERIFAAHTVCSIQT
jgi:hypothetical protein